MQSTPTLDLARCPNCGQYAEAFRRSAEGLVCGECAEAER